MARRPTDRQAIAAIEKHGALLVFPHAGRADPPSLWSVLHPGVTMRWAWDDDADDRVVGLWHQRARLAKGREVVYTKWWKGRAVFFSKALFSAMLASLRATGAITEGLSRDAHEILEVLEDDSPLATKELRKRADLSGRPNEARFQRAMKELWARCLIVGTGEVEEGGFPSLAVGATRWIFEELWTAAAEGASGDPRLESAFASDTAFGKEWRRIVAALSAPG